MKKVLVVTYYWPPAGGIGVQRIAKFCKYLPRHGWTPVVLSVEGGNFSALDKSYEDDVAGVEHVYRASSLEPHGLFRALGRLRKKQGDAGPKTPPSSPPPWLRQLGEYVRLNLFIPDARLGWRRRAVGKAGEILAKEKPAAILSTAPPYTAHLIARELKDRFKLPWIADFRDPWLENPAYNTVPRLGIVKALNRKLEKRVLLSADTIICANEGIRRLTASKVPPSASAKFTVITNGYDRSDVRPSTGKLQRFTASHFGTVYPHGFPFQLFEVFREMIDSDRSFARDFLFRARGIIGSDTLARLGEILPQGNLDTGPYMPHELFLDSLYEDQVLLLIINRHLSNLAHVPAKFYEYLPTGNPILALGPKGGDTDALLSATGAGAMLDYGDRDGMKQFLRDKYHLWKEGSLSRGPLAFPRFDREELAGRLAGKLNELVSPASSRQQN